MGVEIKATQSIEYPVAAPATEYVDIPEGSSSAAPVINPGPKMDRKRSKRLFMPTGYTPFGPVRATVRLGTIPP
jgi:hypothetical protein